MVHPHDQEEHAQDHIALEQAGAGPAFAPPFHLNGINGHLNGHELAASEPLPVNRESVSYRLTLNYVKYRVMQAQYPWPDGLENILEPPAELLYVLCTTADEANRRYSDAFNSMVDNLNITRQNAYTTFVGVLDEVFYDGIRYGRIVVTFAFAAAFAIECFEREMPDLVSGVIHWTQDYIDRFLLNWIEENGGWKAFIEFYEHNPARDVASGRLWRKALQYGLISGLGVGALAIVFLSGRFN